MKFSKSAIAVLVLGAMAAQQAHATNGMNLSGYGPEAHAMGGASMAYDNGTAATMNNPATLALMPEGHRFDAALGGLFPSIKASAGPFSADSSATAFFMPAIGWVNKSGQLVYGAGVFSQGGMGTEYGNNTFMAAGSGEKVRSEVGVGRFIIPVAYQVNDAVTVGGSVDYVWAGMDLKMALTGAQFGDLLPAAMGGTQAYGTAGGSMVGTFGSMMGVNPGQVSGVNWARIDFSNSSAFSGQAQGSGMAGKLGVTFRLSPTLTLGAAFHSKTSLKDLTTSGAKMAMNVNVNGAPGPVTVPISGSVAVQNFQWPQTIGFGAAFQASEQLLVVADYKRIGWKDVMKDFKLTFTADAAQADANAAPLAGKVMDMAMYQNWDDQNVIELGAAFKVNPALTVRAGLNMANNPVPDKFMNPLFPAVAKTNVSGGVGYAFSKQSSVDASFAYVPTNTVTAGNGVKVDFGGTSAQFVYSHRY